MALGSVRKLSNLALPLVPCLRFIPNTGQAHRTLLVLQMYAQDCGILERHLAIVTVLSLWEPGFAALSAPPHAPPTTLPLARVDAEKFYAKQHVFPGI